MMAQAGGRGRAGCRRGCSTMKDCASSQSVHKLISTRIGEEGGKHFNCQKGVRGCVCGEGRVKLTVDCLGSQTDQKLNSCLTFHSKNWILHLAKKFAVRRISSSSSSGCRRKFFSFTTNLSNFRDLRCTFCSPRSLPRVLALRSLPVRFCPPSTVSRRKQNKGPAIFNYGSNQHNYDHKTPLSLPVPVPVPLPEIQTYRYRYRYIAECRNKSTCQFANCSWFSL